MKKLKNSPKIQKFKFQYLGLKIWETSFFIITNTCAKFGAIRNFELVIFLRNLIELPVSEQCEHGVATVTPDTVERMKKFGTIDSSAAWKWYLGKKCPLNIGERLGISNGGTTFIDHEEKACNTFFFFISRI